MADTGVLELLRLIEKADDGVDSVDAASRLGVDHQVVVGAVKSLQSLGDIISAEQRSSKHWELTEEGSEIAKQGSYEARVFSAVPLEGLAQSAGRRSQGLQIGFFTVLEKLLLLQKGSGSQLEDKDKNELKKRKLLSEVTVKSYWIGKGNSFSTTITKQETELTPEMIASGSWKEKKFKPYNFEAMGVAPDCGHLHPLMKVRTQFRQIFLEMGFTEMPTNNFIESSFWNFDSLFQPQQHPARDQHDTFFLSDPALSHEFPQDYLERVKRVHSEGGYGSQGYMYDWKIEEAQKNILRTHTTAVSARMLYKLAQQEKFTPVKYFSIDRVFRNETLDATHLAEFHQIEGVVADYGLTLGDLMGILHQFFTKLGITKLRFKPAYNPYTEPSMEVFSYHEGLKKWVEVGNSGVFRPEMLLPMGLPEDVSVIAWGLSLERPTMIKYGINNIRELVGHKVNLQMVYDGPICRLDS
uniref:Phenylalanine--tRNA ligase alpha subunit n=1 Tax=Neogobius melanostomus TaxID=47308 RepID=A0A8C6TQU7_9GOBI